MDQRMSDVQPPDVMDPRAEYRAFYHDSQHTEVIAEFEAGG